MPNAIAEGTALLRDYRDAGRKEDGNLRLSALQEIGRSNRFVIVEAWKDGAAFDAHGGGAAVRQFRDKLKAIEAAPSDGRVNNALGAGQTREENPAGAVYVVTHVDVVPQGKDTCLAALKTMSADTPKDAGNIAYEALQQTNRSNHFTVIEAWIDRNALDAHAMAVHTRAFRQTLAPLAGAPYDERIYKALD